MIPVEEDALVFALGAFRRLHPLAPSRALPHTRQESNGSAFDISAIVLPHDRLDGLSGLVCVVKWNGGDKVMEDVGLDDTVEEMTADETKFAVNGCGSTARKCPGVSFIVRKGGVRVLEVCNGHCRSGQYAVYNMYRL